VLTEAIIQRGQNPDRLAWEARKRAEAELVTLTTPRAVSLAIEGGNVEERAEADSLGQRIGEAEPTEDKTGAESSNADLGLAPRRDPS